jgi:hypothetical protein
MRNINVTLGLALAILVMLFLLLRSCGNDKISDLESQITLLKGTNDSLYTLTNKLGQKVTSQEAEIVESKEALSVYADSIFKLQRKHEKQIAATIAYWKSKIDVQIVEVEVPYLDTPGMKKFSDSVRLLCKEVIEYMEDSTITVPRTVNIDTLGINGKFTVAKSSFKIDTLNIVDTMHTRVVEIKGGFFKRREIGSKKIQFYKRKSYEVQTMHTSPLFNTTWQKSYIYVPPKKFLLPKIAIPLIGGFLLLNTIL